MLRAPACGTGYVPPPVPPAPKSPVAMRQGLRFGNVHRVGHVGGSRGHLRALRRQVLSSSFPALPRSYRRLCSLVIPAGSLDPAPCGGKEHLSVLRSQKPVFTGFAKHRQPRGGGITPILGRRAKLAGQAWFRPSSVSGSWAYGFNPPSASTQPSPPLAAAARCSQKSSTPHRTAPTSIKRRQRLLLEVLLFKKSALSLAVVP